MPGAHPVDRFSGTTVSDEEVGMGLVLQRVDNFPKLGEHAPDFELTTLDGKSTVRLSSFRGRKPVVLVFGSFT